MLRSRAVRLVLALMLAACGLLLVAMAAWSTWVAYVLANIFNMVHLKNLDWVSATKITCAALVGLVLIYIGLRLISARPIDWTGRRAHRRSPSA